MKTMTEEVRRYLNSVEAELSDLGAEDRSELLADVEEHLTDVAAENEGSLVERLGDPAAYADELRSSAGFPPRVSDVAVDTEPAWRTLVKRIAEDKHVRSARALLVDIEPGWWLLRGYLAVVLVGDLARQDFPFPRINGNQFFGLIMIVLAAWASFALGRWGRRSRVVGVISVIASGLIVLSTIATVAEERSPSLVYEDGDPAPAGIRHWDGSEALNVCPYTSDGELLSGVQVFDQAGRPVTEVPRVPGSSTDVVMNVYPRDIRVPSADGVSRDAPCPELASLKVGTMDHPSWVEAIVGGMPVYRALLGPGETRTFFGEQIFLVVGDAGAVRIRANGKLLESPGARGEIYRGVFDADTETLPPSRTGP